MNTTLIVLGSAIAGIALGHIATAIYFLPKLDDAERRNQAMLDWRKQANNSWQADIELYERNHQ